MNNSAYNSSKVHIVVVDNLYDRHRHPPISIPPITPLSPPHHQPPQKDHDIYKRRLDSNGVAISAGEKHTIGPERLNSNSGTPDCGSCYGAGEEGECCNTCEEVRKAYRRKGWALTSPDSVEQCKREGYAEKLLEQEGEGCHVYGKLLVNKVCNGGWVGEGGGFCGVLGLLGVVRNAQYSVYKQHYIHIPTHTYQHPPTHTK